MNCSDSYSESGSEEDDYDDENSFDESESISGP